jgi:hypothetical protein
MIKHAKFILVVLFFLLLLLFLLQIKKEHFNSDVTQLNQVVDYLNFLCSKPNKKYTVNVSRIPT